ncbi:MAG: M1 family aminopeptidase [Anaerolineales bacterium]
MMNKHAGVTALILLAISCGQAPTESSLTPEAIPPAITEQPPSEPELPPELEAPARRTLYTLDATLDFSAHFLAVSERISFVNNDTDPLVEIILLVEAENLRAGFNIVELTGEFVESFTHQPGRITVTLREPLLAGNETVIELRYELALPQHASWLGWTERQTNLLDWYPFIPPYVDSEGWVIHPPAPVGEHLAFNSADFDVRITLQNAPAGAVVAGAASAIREGDVWHFNLQNARRFGWSVSGQYRTLNTVSRNTPITIYFFEEHRDAAEASLEASSRALEIYSDLFGEYPYGRLSVVEAQFPDGMESDAIYFLDQFYFLTYNYSPGNYLITLSAHETAHNWWFGAIGNNQAVEPWLDEAFSTYSEFLFYERAHPNLTDWWWDFRVNSHSPNGPVDLTIYERTNFEAYVGAVYLNGAMFLHELRGAMGDEAFFGFLREYFTVANGRLVDSEEFFWRLAYAVPDINSVRPIMDEYFRLADN